MFERALHLIHLLVRDEQVEAVRCLLYPHERWHDPADEPYLALPAKKTVTDPLALFQPGTSVDEFVATIAREELGLAEDDFALEQELPAVQVPMTSPTRGELTHYTLYAIDLWVDPAKRAAAAATLDGVWLTLQEALQHPRLSPTARAVLEGLLKREDQLAQHYRTHPEDAKKADAPRLLLQGVPAHPSMDALAKRWFHRNKHGVGMVAASPQCSGSSRTLRLESKT